MQPLPELTNLLPIERIHASRRTYFFRLGIVTLFMFSALVVMSGVLLVPAYLLAHQQVSERKGETLRLGARLAGSEEQAVNARVKALTAASQHLSALAGAPAASTVVAALVRLPRPGIALTSFTYTASSATASTTLVVSGEAADRDSLRRYVTLLSSQPFVASANLPISAYARETDIDFSITLSGSLTPSLP